MRRLEKEIILVGGGGHAKVVIDAIRRSREFHIHGIVDPKLKGTVSVLGIKVIGGDTVLPDIFKKGIKDAFICIGSIGNCDIRKRLYANLKNLKFRLPVIVHPRATVADDVEFGEGTFVAAGTVINPGVKIGKNAIINTKASIDHDCELGDFVHIAPGATLSGNVKIGDETHIGTGANVLQCLRIGEKCMIAAGTTVRQNWSKGIYSGDYTLSPDAQE